MTPIASQCFENVSVLFATSRLSDFHIPCRKFPAKRSCSIWTEFWSIQHPPWRAFGPGGHASMALIPKKSFTSVHGRPSIATIRELLPDADHEAENREVERREILDVDGVDSTAGVVELLTSLPADRWTIVTSCTRPLADVRLRAAGISTPGRIHHRPGYHRSASPIPNRI